jgi:hypothetical protein
MFGEDMTIEKCADFCDRTTYFGTEYGGECYCGSAFAGAMEKVVESDCSFLCKGNQKQYCGAGGRLSVWTKLE